MVIWGMVYCCFNHIIIIFIIIIYIYVYIYIYPIGSMYAIYGNIYHKYTPNVSIYTSTMDPMGIYGTPICIGYPHLCHQTSPKCRKVHH